MYINVLIWIRSIFFYCQYIYGRLKSQAHTWMFPERLISHRSEGSGRCNVHLIERNHLIAFVRDKYKLLNQQFNDKGLFVI